MVKTGWSHNLKVRFKYNLQSLVSRIRGKTPRGETGKLASGWRVSGDYIHLTGDHEDIIIDNPSLVAKVQEYGATIPAYDATEGSVMHFDGVFAKSRKGFELPGQHYVEGAVHDWLDDTDAITAEWDGK